jgi:hypothetical protein
MNSKERVYTALRQEEPDRVPRGENKFDNVFFKGIMGYDTLCYAGWEVMEALWAGRRDEVIADYIDAIPALAERLQWDYIPCAAHAEKAVTTPAINGFRARLSKRRRQNLQLQHAVGTISMPENIQYGVDQ